MKIAVIGTMKEGWKLIESLMQSDFNCSINPNTGAVDVAIFSVESDEIEESLLAHMKYLDFQTIVMHHHMDLEVSRVFKRYIGGENVLLYKIHEGCLTLMPKGNGTHAICHTFKEVLASSEMAIEIKQYSESGHWDEILIDILVYMVESKLIAYESEQFEEVLNEMFQMLKRKSLNPDIEKIRMNIELHKSGEKQIEISTFDQWIKLMKHLIHTGKESNQSMNYVSSIYKMCLGN